MKIIKCQSCGAPLKFATCGHCGAFHHDENSKMKQFLVPTNTTETEIQAITGMQTVYYGLAIVRPALVAELKYV